MPSSPNGPVQDREHDVGAEQPAGRRAARPPRRRGATSPSRSRRPRRARRGRPRAARRAPRRPRRARRRARTSARRARTATLMAWVRVSSPGRRRGRRPAACRPARGAVNAPTVIVTVEPRGACPPAGSWLEHDAVAVLGVDRPACDWRIRKPSSDRRAMASACGLAGDVGHLDLAAARVATVRVTAEPSSTSVAGGGVLLAARCPAPRPASPARRTVTRRPASSSVERAASSAAADDVGHGDLLGARWRRRASTGCRDRPPRPRPASSGSRGRARRVSEAASRRSTSKPARSSRRRADAKVQPVDRGHAPPPPARRRRSASPSSPPRPAAAGGSWPMTRVRAARRRCACWTRSSKPGAAQRELGGRTARSADDVGHLDLVAAAAQQQRRRRRPRPTTSSSASAHHHHATPRRRASLDGSSSRRLRRSRTRLDRRASPARRTAGGGTKAVVGSDGHAGARGLQRGDELVGVGEALRRVLLAARAGRPTSSSGVTAGCRRSAATGVSETCLSAIVTALSPSNGHAAGEQLVEHDPDRVEVRRAR